jgi:hypothetical protein
MIVHAADPRQTPSWRNMTGMKEQCAFNWTFPCIVQRNIADRDGVAPMHAVRSNRRQACAAHERKLTFLEDNAA